MTLSGSRVLAIGYKYIQNATMSAAKQLTRAELECSLEFGGFLVVSCPLKSDSKSVMKDILDSSHHVAMITGDNELTACHVAKELRIIQKEKDHSRVMVLKVVDNANRASDDRSMINEKWAWMSIDDSHMIPLEKDERNATKSNGPMWWKRYSFCLTGSGLQYLQDISASK